MDEGASDMAEREMAVQRCAVCGNCDAAQLEIFEDGMGGALHCRVCRSVTRISGGRAEDRTRAICYATAGEIDLAEYRFTSAVSHYERASTLFPRDPEFLLGWICGAFRVVESSMGCLFCGVCPPSREELHAFPAVERFLALCKESRVVRAQYYGRFQKVRMCLMQSLEAPHSERFDVLLLHDDRDGSATDDCVWLLSDLRLRGAKVCEYVCNGEAWDDPAFVKALAACETLLVALRPSALARVDVDSAIRRWILRMRIGEKRAGSLLVYLPCETRLDREEIPLPLWDAHAPIFLPVQRVEMLRAAFTPPVPALCAPE